MVTACATQWAPDVIETVSAVEEVTPIAEPAPVVEETAILEEAAPVEGAVVVEEAAPIPYVFIICIYNFNWKRLKLHPLRLVNL